MTYPPDAAQTSMNTKEAILAAAEELFAQKGFEGAKTQEIADRASTDKKLIFYYYTSKKGLYMAVLENFLQGIEGVFSAARSMHIDNPEGLELFVSGFTDFLSANQNAVRILFREIMDEGFALENIARTTLRPIFEEARGNLESSMAAGKIRKLDPMHYMLNLGGMHLLYFMALPLIRHIWDRDPLAPEVLANRKHELAQLLLHGIWIRGA